MFVSGVHNDFKFLSFHGKNNEKKSSSLKYILPVAVAMTPVCTQVLQSETPLSRDSFFKTENNYTDSTSERTEISGLLADMNVSFKPEFTQKLISNKTFTIDPGHGGKTKSGHPVTGTYYRNPESKKVYFEKDIALEISKKVKEYLEKLGANVVLTRDSDDYVDLTDRALIAQENNSDVFLSIHLDHNNVRRVKGPTVYKYKPEIQEGETKLRKINNPENNDLLADALHTAMTELYNEEYGYKDFFPIKENDFRVCRESNVKRSKDTKIPASALVECGFLSNPDEAKLLITPEHQDKIAKALVKALLNYAFEKTPPELKEQWLNEENNKYNTYLFSTGLY